MTLPERLVLTADKSSVPRLPTMPCGDELDDRIRKLAVPAIVSFMILPLAQATDLFFVGRMGDALALAGQAATNQVYSACAFVTSTIPTILVPRVAKAKAAGDEAAVQRAVGEAIFVSAFLCVLLTLLIGVGQRTFLLALGNPNALPFSLPYLRARLPGIVLDGTSAVAFATFRGVMDTVTPLQVSAVANLINVLLDPLLIFTAGMGIAGAGLATTFSQLFSATAYIALLLRRRLVTAATIFRLPSAAALRQIATAGGAVQLRAIALNVAFIGITKTVQGLDSTGTAAAAHAVTLQLWQLGGVILFALSTVASIIVPAELTKGKVPARAAASRLLAWGGLLGAGLGLLQLAALPLLGVFTPLPEVQRAARIPSILGALLQPLNGMTFIGEGVMVGTQSFGQLAGAQVAATLTLLGFLRLAPSGLNWVWCGFFLFNGVRFANVIRHHFFSGPLVSARRRAPGASVRE